MKFLLKMLKSFPKSLSKDVACFCLVLFGYKFGAGFIQFFVKCGKFCDVLIVIFLVVVEVVVINQF